MGMNSKCGLQSKTKRKCKHHESGSDCWISSIPLSEEEGSVSGVKSSEDIGGKTVIAASSVRNVQI